MSGLAAAWGRLSREQHQAALAAVGLVVALFLPWYEKSLFQTTGRGKLISAASNLSAFQVISWVEAAVMLVAAGVLFLLWARSQEKGFHLPGGDGTVIFAAGCWAALLLIWRLFDKPDVAGAGATVGIQWGWFVALVMAGLLAAAGARVRAAHRPEPPLPVEDEGWEPPPGGPPGGGVESRRAQRRRHARGAGAAGEMLREPPAWEGEPPAAPGRIRPSAPPVADPSEAPTEHGPASGAPSRAPIELGPASEDPSEAPTKRGPAGDPSEAPTERGPAPRDASEAPTERHAAPDPSEAPTERGTAARRREGSEDRLF